MTIDSITLKELVEKGSDADLLREMITFIAGRMMELDVEMLTGAAHGERSPNRINQRNGYRERTWETRVGAVPLAIPKLRKGSYFPSFPGAAAGGREGAHCRHPGSLRAGRLHPLGRRPGQGHGMSGISKSQVSRLCAEIDERVKAFLERPLEELRMWPNYNCHQGPTNALL